MKALPSRPLPGPGPASALRWVLMPAVVTLQTGCMEMMRSDAENFGGQTARARQEALQSNRLASQQAAPAQPLAGAALTQLLAGKSHVSEYRKASGDAQPYYAVYAYYSPDGRYLWLNTYEQRDPATTLWGTWQVSGDVLCVTQQRGEPAPDCHTLRLQTDGTVQYWTHRPDDPFHGLLSARVSIIREGPQTPAFVSLPSQMR